MKGWSFQVTMQNLFLTAILALISVLTESISSPLSTGSVDVRMVERIGPSATAAKGDYCNRRYAAKLPSNQRQEDCQQSMFAYVSTHKLAVQQDRDLTAISDQQKTTSSPSFRAEMQALIAFKESVTEDSLGALNSWNSNDSSACHWRGVTCDLPSKSITALELVNLELVGSISPLLGRLQYLQSLDLSGNFFHGEIPISLQNCSNLSHLALRDNNLTGQIPSELGDLYNLKYLDLSNNLLLGVTFPASLGNCSLIRLLFLNFTNVEGAIPSSVGQLTHLEIMNVTATALSGAIPGSLGNCSSLTQLMMGNAVGGFQFLKGGLSGEIPPEMGSLTRLNTLAIQGSYVSGRFPGWIANLTRLTHLSLDDSYLRGEIPHFLGKLPLEKFNVEWNNFTGAFPTTLINCSHLTFLSLSTNNFGGAIPPEIGLFNKMTRLSIAGNPFSGTIPSSLANCSSLNWVALQSPTMGAQNFPSWITSLVDLTYLYLGPLNLQGSIPGDIGRLFKLETLVVFNNSVTGPIPATIGNCSLLQMLELAQLDLSGEVPLDIWLLSEMKNLVLGLNHLTGTLPASIGNLSQMGNFELFGNKFTGVIPEEIGSLKNLYYFAVGTNNFSGSIPTTLGNMSAVTLLDLSDNQLIGVIPTSIGNLTRLQGLYLDDNRLQGSIPEDLMRCTQLIDLQLYGNYLGGNIPEDIGNLQSIQTLLVYKNKLSGVVPNSLGRCISLIKLDLSYNFLNGIIPPVVIAQTSSTLSFCNMSHNHLSGPLPQELAQLEVITYLDFSANNLSGSIPSGLGECKSLISLDLSVNNLSGSIPQTLVQLKDLTFFNVSDNNLGGPVPNGGIFATNTVTAASFLGNDGLCGSILGRGCANVAPSKSAHASTCRGFRCTSIRIAVGCSVTGLLFVVLVLIWWFRKGKLDMTKGDEIATTFEHGLKMSKEDLAAIMSGPQNVIGVGAKSIVYKAVLGGDQIVAIKTLSARGNDSNHDHKQLEANLLREAHMLSKLQHRNILKVLGCFRSPEVVALISQFMPRASLNDQLYPSSDDGPQTCELNWDARLHIAMGVAHGLVYLHNQFHEPIIHCDLKPSNILLDEALDPKLGDFGVSKFVNPNRDGEKTASTLCASVGYIPPEYGTTTTVSTKGDVYSYGVILLELLTRRHPILVEGTESEECKHLVDWVLESFEEDPLATLDSYLIEESINNENKREQMKLLMRVGLLCTREEPHDRPRITDVVGMLNQITERGSDQVGLPSMAQLVQEPTVWDSTQDPTSLESTSS